MHAWVYGLASVVLVGGPALAQEPSKSGSEGAPSLTSDAKALETRALIQKARQRQLAVDRRNTDLWQRWTYAVCIGCGGSLNAPTRIVHTTPSRVLAGIPAADDDARERGWRFRVRA